MNYDEFYKSIEEEKHNLNFLSREDVDTVCGKCRFKTLFFDKEKGLDDIPDKYRAFLEQEFKMKRGSYDFIQIQKYEIGDYILPHKDTYPHFNLIMLSTSSIDGLTIEDKDGTFKVIPDKAGTLIDIPKYRWHWVNPVREKTRYTAVIGIRHIYTDIDELL